MAPGPKFVVTIFPPTRSLPPPGRGAASGHRSLESSENGFHSGGRGGCSARCPLAVRKQSKRPRFRWLFGDFLNHDGQEGWEFYGIFHFQMTDVRLMLGPDILSLLRTDAIVQKDILLMWLAGEMWYFQDFCFHDMVLTRGLEQVPIFQEDVMPALIIFIGSLRKIIRRHLNKQVCAFCAMN